MCRLMRWDRLRVTYRLSLSRYECDVRFWCAFAFTKIDCLFRNSALGLCRGKDFGSECQLARGGTTRNVVITVHGLQQIVLSSVRKWSKATSLFTSDSKMNLLRRIHFWFCRSIGLDVFIILDIISKVDSMSCIECEMRNML